MATKKEENWKACYNALHDYIKQNGHLPDKKKEENRGLLNWWKYNKKCIKQGRLDDEKIRLLQILSDMRQPSDKPQEQIKPLRQLKEQ